MDTKKVRMCVECDNDKLESEMEQDNPALEGICKECAAKILKICSTCQIQLPLSAYHKQSGGKFGVRSVCIDCVRSYSRAQRREEKSFLCRDCGNPRQKKSSLCAECSKAKREAKLHSKEHRAKRNEMSTQWRAKNPDAWKEIYTRANRKAALKRSLKSVKEGTGEYFKIMNDILELEQQGHSK